LEKRMVNFGRSEPLADLNVNFELHSRGERVSWEGKGGRELLEEKNM